MKAISGFDLTVSAVVTEYLASCEHKQVFLVIATEDDTVPPLRFLHLVVRAFPLLVAQLQLQVCTELQLVDNLLLWPRGAMELFRQ